MARKQTFGQAKIAAHKKGLRIVFVKITPQKKRCAIQKVALRKVATRYS